VRQPRLAKSAACNAAAVDATAYDEQYRSQSRICGGRRNITYKGALADCVTKFTGNGFCVFVFLLAPYCAFYLESFPLMWIRFLFVLKVARPALQPPPPLSEPATLARFNRASTTRTRPCGTVTVDQLAEMLGVALQTQVRRGVQRWLADEGLLTRFHGGVCVPSSTTETLDIRSAHAPPRARSELHARRGRAGSQTTVR
jgi:hypothetical protein